MANNKSNKSKKNVKQQSKSTGKRRRTRPARKGNSSSVNGGINAAYGAKPKNMRPRPNSKTRGVHEHICSQLDPFCVIAKGARIPDGLGNGTLPYQVRYHMTPTNVVAVTGILAQVIGCALPFPAIVMTTGTWTTGINMNASQMPTFFTTNAEAFRVVSWGFVVRSILPAMTAQGFIQIKEINQYPLLNTANAIAQFEVSGSEVVTYPLVSGMEISVVGKPINGIESRQFKSVTGILQNTQPSENGWAVYMVEVNGAAATAIPVYDIEVYYNLEISLKSDQTSVLQAVSSAPAKVAPQVLTLADKTRATTTAIMQGGIEKAGATILSRVESTVESFLSDGLAMLGL